MKKRSPRDKSQPSNPQEKAVWVSLSRRSKLLILVGALLAAPYVAMLAWLFVGPYFGIYPALGADDRDLTIWAIMAGIGLLLVLCGGSLRRLARTELQKIERTRSKSRRK